MESSLASLPQASASQASAAYAQSKANAAGRAAPPSSNGTLQKLWQNAQDFETVFLENMFEHLTSGLSGDGPLGAGGAGGEIYRGMLTQQLRSRPSARAASALRRTSIANSYGCRKGEPRMTAMQRAERLLPPNVTSRDDAEQLARLVGEAMTRLEAVVAEETRLLKDYSLVDALELMSPKSEAGRLRAGARPAEGQCRRVRAGGLPRWSRT